MIEKKKKSFCLLLVDCFLQFFVIVLDELLRIHSMSYWEYIPIWFFFFFWLWNVAKYFLVVEVDIAMQKEKEPSLW